MSRIGGLDEVDLAHRGKTWHVDDWCGQLTSMPTRVEPVPPHLVGAHRILSFRSTVSIHVASGAVALGSLIAGALAPAPILVAFAALVVGAEAAIFVRLQRRAAPIVRCLVDVASLVEQGRYDEAAIILDAQSRVCRWIPNLHALLIQKRSDLLFAAGRLDEAEALARIAEQSGWLSRPRGGLYIAYPALCSTLAVIAALRDDTVGAEVRRKLAHSAVSEVKRGSLIFMDALLLARAGRYADAVRQIQTVGSEGRVQRPYVSVLRWIYAYSAAEAGGGPDAVARLVDAAKPSTSEVLALAPAWPMLAAFARAHA